MLPQWLMVPAAEATAPPRTSQQDSTKLVVFTADPATAMLLRKHLRRDALGLQCLAGVEIIDAGLPATATIRPARLGRGERLASSMSRHQLDVALSRGRHSAERAKLAGYTMLVCACACPKTSWDMLLSALSQPVQVGATLPTRDRREVYGDLRDHGEFAIAALVGAIIACAQMGLRVHARGASGALAAAFAAGLHPGVLEWLECRRAGSH